MDVRRHQSVEEFRTIAGPLYGRDPVTHTVELTLLHSGPVSRDALLLTVWDGDDLAGAAIQTPPYPLIASAIPPGARTAVVHEVLRLRPDLDAVRGPREGALAFADAWRTARGIGYRITVEERLHRLGTLLPPDGVAGAPGRATAGDRPLLVDWIESFYGETFGHPRDDDAAHRFVDAAERAGDQILLWMCDGYAVSLAVARAPAWGVSRIGPVFTPAERRGRGFGSAVTAAAARAARVTGAADVVLYTDLANPVSNAIYRRIGFEPVHDGVRIALGDA